jgi:hypothetical protein
VGRAGDAQCAQYTDLTSIQPESPEHIFLVASNMQADSGDARGHLVGAHIQARANGRPSRQ